MITPEYAAGFFDGEGCVSYSCIHRSESRTPIEKRKRRGSGTNYCEWIVRLTLSNTNLDVLLAFQDTWGGNVRANLPNGRNCKIIHQWIVLGYAAETFCYDILPYMIVKKRQVELFLEFRATVNSKERHRLTEEIHQKRLAIGQEIINLNSRGINPVKRTLVIREHHLRPYDNLRVRPICVINGCDRPSKSLDLCNRHYLQHYRNEKKKNDNM